MPEPAAHEPAPVEPASGEPGSADAAPIPVVRFTTQPTSGDVMVNGAALVRASPIIQTVGAFTTASALIGLSVGDRVASILLLIVGLLFLSGVIFVPLVWWSIRQRGDVILAPITIEADANGLTVTASFASSRQSWSLYRRAREVSRSFLLDMGTGASVMVPKRGVSTPDQEAFRGLLADAGLLSQPGLARRLRPLLWIGIGIAGAILLVQGPRLIAGLDATATMDIEVAVQGESATVHGTTDLPDGSNVTVDILQLDEWERASEDGTQPAYDSPWWQYADVTVQDGTFTTSFSIAGWPAGRGLARAYFWMDSAQPDAAIDRFGLDGQELRGPDVTDDPDYGQLLQVQQPFEIP